MDNDKLDKLERVARLHSNSYFWNPAHQVVGPEDVLALITAARRPGVSADITADREFLHGMRMGWNLCSTDNRAKYDEIVEGRANEIREAKPEARRPEPISDATLEAMDTAYESNWSSVDPLAAPRAVADILPARRPDHVPDVGNMIGRPALPDREAVALRSDKLSDAIETALSLSDIVVTFDSIGRRYTHIVNGPEVAGAILRIVERALSPAQAERDADREEVAKLTEFSIRLSRLRESEGSSVTLLCDNPDFNGQPSNAIEVCGEWTDWEDRRFTGDTLHAAVLNAYRAMLSAAPKEGEGSSLTCPECGVGVGEHHKSDCAILSILLIPPTNPHPRREGNEPAHRKPPKMA